VTLVRILVADCHDVIRVGVRQTLEARASWEIVAEAADGDEAVSKAIEAKPDVAIVDYSLVFNGIEVIRRIRAHLPRTEFLIFTTYDNETVIEEALRAGARGYVLKTDGNGTLISAVESLALRKPFFSAQIPGAVLLASRTRSNGSGSPLTNRERGIVQLIAEGHSNKQIAKLLRISAKTVETHRLNIMRKLNISSSARLVRYAIRNKLIEA
jgi:DNA-binding NarL/FixJ family response regulator